jgi:hypothetical protein
VGIGTGLFPSCRGATFRADLNPPPYVRSPSYMHDMSPASIMAPSAGQDRFNDVVKYLAETGHFGYCPGPAARVRSAGGTGGARARPRAGRRGRCPTASGPPGRAAAAAGPPGSSGRCRPPARPRPPGRGAGRSPVAARAVAAPAGRPPMRSAGRRGPACPNPAGHAAGGAARARNAARPGQVTEPQQDGHLTFTSVI